ncbi:MAG TPA: amidohydrolase family protein [Pirellulales bacterium]|nr:amidohydrolase family protein [Pirellulales bacterium]
MNEAIVDVNVYLSRWPFRRVSADEPTAIADKLRSQGVVQAWAGSLDSLLHRDLGSVNERLAAECRAAGEGFLLPFGAVNLRLPDWEEDLRRCHEEFGMPGIRLHPNYHGYKLDDPLAAKLLSQAAEHGLIVQLAVTMEDERTQHPLVQVPHVDAAPLVELVKRTPKLRLVLLNAFRALRPELRGQLVAAGQVYFEIASLEGVGGVEKLFGQIPGERILFGSYAPLFYFESALLKLQESQLGQVQLEAIRKGNAKWLLAAI